MDYNNQVIKKENFVPINIAIYQIKRKSKQQDKELENCKNVFPGVCQKQSMDKPHKGNAKPRNQKKIQKDDCCGRYNS